MGGGHASAGRERPSARGAGCPVCRCGSKLVDDAHCTRRAAKVNSRPRALRRRPAPHRPWVVRFLPLPGPGGTRLAVSARRPRLAAAHRAGARSRPAVGHPRGGATRRSPGQKPEDPGGVTASVRNTNATFSAARRQRIARWLRRPPTLPRCRQLRRWSGHPP